jgi:flagellar motility protein MotE (MotC chaperone)
MKPSKALRVADQRPPESRGTTFRLLPITLAAVLVMLTIKVGDVWNGFSVLSDGLHSNEANAQIRNADISAGVQKPEIVSKAVVAPETFPNPSRFTQEEIEALNQLASRRDQLDRREMKIKSDEAVVQAAFKNLEERLKEFEVMKRDLEGLLTQSDTAQDNRLRSLVRIYEAMKPKEAAQIFDKLEMDVLLGVAQRMKEGKVAPILASMQPEKAKLLTQILAVQGQAPTPPTPR